MTLPIVILSGGLATRMHPLTTTLPKSLLPVAGKPFIDHQLQSLKQQGIQHVVLCVGFLGEMLQAHVQNGDAFGLHVTYSFDGPTLLGTGGALQKALPLLGEVFFVLYGDSLLTCDFSAVEEAFIHHQKPALMTVLKNNNQWDKSNVHFQQGQLLTYNKHTPSPEMTYIDYGLGVLSKTTLQQWPQQLPFDLADLYQTLAQQQQLAGFEVFGRFYEIGSHQGLQETEAFLSDTPS